MSCLYPTGRARSTRTSCPSTPSATMFSAAAASPPPPSPTYPLPLLSPSPTPSHPPFTGIVLCHLAVRRCWAARAPLRRRCGPVRAAPGRTGPWECGIVTHCAESPCFIQSTESGAETGAVGRMQSHGAAAGTQSNLPVADGISSKIS